MTNIKKKDIIETYTIDKVECANIMIEFPNNKIIVQLECYGEDGGFLLNMFKEYDLNKLIDVPKLIKQALKDCDLCEL